VGALIPIRARHAQAGALLIEVLVTIVVVVIGILGLLQLHSRLQKSEMESYQRSQAMMLVNDMASRISTNRYNALEYVTVNPLGSGFNCAGIGTDGARGLLQVMPRTARQLGIRSLETPEQQISAGVRYLAWVRERFPPTLAADERPWFALAAYNAGFGHVQDARRVARDRGWDANRWFGHVERAMPLLRRRSVHDKTSFGYCRCNEVTPYVREIRDRYVAFVRVVS